MDKPYFYEKTDAKADGSQMLTVDGLRLTLLSPRLLRVENADTCTDLPSFTVINRRFAAGRLRVYRKGKALLCETDEVVFRIENGVPVRVRFKDDGRSVAFAKTKNLKGTRRTLDMTFGAAALEDGLVTEEGAYLLDDSDAPLIGPEGDFVPRRKGATDYYAFACGRDPAAAVRTFYRIAGPAPLVPRFALGVWWSRYHAYSAEEYLTLMDRFAAENVPLTVATVDMDWHWVGGLKERFGEKYRGWTGYSWNTELFPDPPAFLRALHGRGLKVTLNLHPADGVHAYEDAYPAMAAALGKDPAKKERIPFSCADRAFRDAYFTCLHHPLEAQGVDFWWLDWQQGRKSDAPGLDPLNALNRWHYLDNARNGRLPLILSRYAGLGSHRYPLGFSGDTAITWATLAFQPYFTANAANAAYGWWSHDIGGHHLGGRDDALYLRWLQFGVFAPILRLHSTASDLLGKEPWRYSAPVCENAKYWLRFRHRLIPYLYTMDRRAHGEGRALCEPMYYAYPDASEAYTVPNQYLFGTELTVCPITAPQHTELNMGSARTWLPEGRWTDFFTGRSYRGGREVTFFRELTQIPVLGKPGAILPLSADAGNGTGNPRALELWALAGDGDFTLTEDHGGTDFAEHTARTRLSIRYREGTLRFTVYAAEGDRTVLPETRDWTVRVVDTGEVFTCRNLPVTETREFIAENVSLLPQETPHEAVVRVFSRWQAANLKKEALYRPFKSLNGADEIRAALKKHRLPQIIALAIEEALCCVFSSGA